MMATNGYIDKQGRTLLVKSAASKLLEHSAVQQLAPGIWCLLWPLSAHHLLLQAQKLPSLGLQPRVWCFLGQPHEHIEVSCHPDLIQIPPCSTLQSHKLAGHLSELTRGMKGQLLVNTDRYCFHLETLAKLLRKGHTVRVDCVGTKMWLTWSLVQGQPPGHAHLEGCWVSKWHQVGCWHVSRQCPSPRH